MVKPKMVYISQTTEAGTVYSKEELKEIYQVTKELGMYLFVDGARLASALATNLMTLDDLAHYSDVFYIGATKNGSPLGEAICIVNDELKSFFRYSIKQNGGMYSKGYVAGICFEELFKDNLYFSLGENANKCAKYLASNLSDRGILLAYPCVTNQVFPVVSNEMFLKLKEIVSFELWEDRGESKIIRFVCNFKTTLKMIDDFFIQFDKIK
jgi:threonine aldolase